jgi:ankyrin repeat protein
MRMFSAGVVALAVVGASLVPSTSHGATGSATIVEVARRGDAAALRALVKAGSDVNAPAVDGTTALHWAAQHGDVDTVGLLIRSGAQVDARNRYGVTPLRVAAGQGSAAVVEALLRAGGSADAVREESGESLLMVAARAGHTDVVRALLAHGANVNVVEPRRAQSALMWAAAEGHPAVVRVLVESGADIRALSSTKISPMMFAIRAGDLESTQVLLDSGLDVNGQAADGTHMLTLAILNGRFELAKVLLERGADANVDDPHGKPLHTLAFLRKADNRALSTVLPRQLPQTGVDAFVLATALLDRGADIDARYAITPENGTGGAPPPHMAIGKYRVSLAGATPFFIAAITADLPFMRFLASKGADPAISTLSNVTPLLGASGIGFWEGETTGTNAEALEAVKLAAALGNDPKAVVGGGLRPDRNWDGSTAMHGAANRGSPEIVGWLADQGVPLDSTSNRGLRPYHHAAGLDGYLFHASPATAELLIVLAEARGDTIDRTEPDLKKQAR